jgi:hypothetical protein
VDLATVKMVIAWTLVNNRYLVHMDISAAFLNGKMDVDLYLRLPKGTHSPFGEDGIWKPLVRSMEPNKPPTSGLRL